MRVGLLSDTHGLLRPAVLDWLRGCDHLVHAGDVCDARTLAALQAFSGDTPLTVVRGNNDVGPWAEALPPHQRLTLAGVSILVVHDIADAPADPAAQGLQVVVTGHSHQPRHEQRAGVHWVNPGSAGPRRFRLPIAAGALCLADGAVTVQLTEFAHEPANPR